MCSLLKVGVIKEHYFLPIWGNDHIGRHFTDNFADGPDWHRDQPDLPLLKLKAPEHKQYGAIELSGRSLATECDVTTDEEDEVKEVKRKDSVDSASTVRHHHAAAVHTQPNSAKARWCNWVWARQRFFQQGFITCYHSKQGRDGNGHSTNQKSTFTLGT